MLADETQVKAPNQEQRIKLDESWKQRLLTTFSQPYMQNLRAYLAEEKRLGKVIYPPGKDIFNAFNLTPFEQVKVVILGQDPYHGPKQAHGLCFSVQPEIKPPPSLVNIFREIESDLGRPLANRGGNLESWARQGVLLLNAVLTVERGRAGAHQSRGWEQFTDEIIERLNQEYEHLVFLLWGSYAQKKGQIIDSRRHLVLKAPHPSPLSAYRGFMGCRHFSRTNQYLEANGRQPIDWCSL